MVELGVLFCFVCVGVDCGFVVWCFVVALFVLELTLALVFCFALIVRELTVALVFGVWHLALVLALAFDFGFGFGVWRLALALALESNPNNTPFFVVCLPVGGLDVMH